MDHTGLHELPFAKLVIIRDDIVEVMINEGVELNLDMVNQYHEFLLSHLKAPFSIIVNRIHSYTYDFEAQLSISSLPEIHAIAAVVYSRVARFSMESMASIPREKTLHSQFFNNKEDALIWAISQQEKLKIPEHHSS